jgi:hypothetical protein
MKRKLRVTENGRSRELLLVGTMAVGRDPQCDISASDPLLSRRHAELEARADCVIVRDLQSRNGILVNGRKVQQTVLSPGDRVQVAGIRIEYVDDLESSADEPTIRTPSSAYAAPPPAARRDLDETTNSAVIASSALDSGAFEPALDDRRPAEPPADDDNTRFVPRTEDLSLKLRTISSRRPAAAAPPPPAVPRALLRTIRASSLALTVFVYGVTALLVSWRSASFPVPELLVAAILATAGAFVAARLAARALTSQLASAAPPNGTDAPAGGPGARSSDPDLPLQQWPPAERPPARHTLVVRS